MEESHTLQKQGVAGVGMATEDAHAEEGAQAKREREPREPDYACAKAAHADGEVAAAVPLLRSCAKKRNILESHRYSKS